MYLSRLRYVGHNIMYTSLNVQKVWRQIRAIKQIYSYGGKVRTNTIDELFDKFTSLSISVSDDATTWSIQLAHLFCWH